MPGASEDRALSRAAIAPLLEWAHADVSAVDGQPPWVELGAEHMLANVVFDAMEEETRRLYARGELRIDFWRGVLEFITAFVESTHRRKEEDVLFPLLAQCGDASDRAAVTHLTDDHGHADKLTRALAEGISEGDWEQVLRAAMVYISGIRKHMRAEIATLTRMSALTITPHTMGQVRLETALIEREALGERGRDHVIRLARRLCNEASIAFPLP